MPVQFRFSHLEIRTFRGIRDLSIRLPAGVPLHLIGANNAGKSTVMQALAFALYGGGFHKYTTDQFDFFRDSSGQRSGEFSVTLHLEVHDPDHLPVVQGVGKPIHVHALRAFGKVKRDGRLEHQNVLVGSDQKPITTSPSPTLRGVDKDVFKEHGVGWRPRYARPVDIRDHLPEVWLLAPQNLRDALYRWKTGPLQRLSQMLAGRFLEDEWEFQKGEERRQMPDTMVRAHRFFSDAASQFPFWKDDLRPKLQSTLSQYIGTVPQVDLRPTVQALDEWLTQQLLMSFATDAGGATTPLDKMGDGWQSLMRMAALEVVSEYPDLLSRRVALLVEEPETHLHPHLRRKFRSVLERLAGKGWVVVTATHSPEFVSFATGQRIVRLWREGDLVVKGELSTNDVGAEAKFQEKLDEHGNHDMLFAQRVVLCEGKDDVYAVRSGLSKLNADLDSLSVSLVNAGSVTAMPSYAEMAHHLRIPWFAITDEDTEDSGQTNPVTGAARTKLEGLKTAADQTAIWKGDLEKCLAKPTGKARPEWQAKNLEPLTLDEMQSKHPNYIAVCKEVKDWIQPLDTAKAEI